MLAFLTSAHEPAAGLRIVGVQDVWPGAPEEPSGTPARSSPHGRFGKISAMSCFAEACKRLDDSKGSPTAET